MRMDSWTLDMARREVARFDNDPSVKSAGPVVLGRALLLRAIVEEDRALELMTMATKVLYTGWGDRENRTFHDSDAYREQCDAMFWFGISLALSGNFPESVDALQTTATSWLWNDHHRKAGRCYEEIAEVLRLLGDAAAAKGFFRDAIAEFDEAGDQNRARRADLALRRSPGDPLLPSAFLTREKRGDAHQEMDSDVAGASTIVGSSQGRYLIYLATAQRG
jgi:hypothetical protein